MKISEVSNLIYKWIQILAIVVAGSWAFYHFYLRGGTDWMGGFKFQVQQS